MNTKLQKLIFALFSVAMLAYTIWQVSALPVTSKQILVLLRLWSINIGSIVWLMLLVFNNKFPKWIAVSLFICDLTGLLPSLPFYPWIVFFVLLNVAAGTLYLIWASFAGSKRSTQEQ